MGAGASVVSSVIQNIGNQTVRQVAKIGVESAVETAIDTGIDLATGNQITGQTLAMNFAFNTFTNGAGSVSSKKAAKADVNTGKPKAGDVPVTKSRQSSTPVQQLALPGPKSKPLALPAPEPVLVLALPDPKTKPQTDFYAGLDGTTYVAGDTSLTGTIKSNLGNSYDVTPEKISNKYNPTTGIPNSSMDILDRKTDDLLTRRYYDKNGKAYRDVDITYHGNMKQHPEAPHEHFWKYDSNGKILGR